RPGASISIAWPTPFIRSFARDARSRLSRSRLRAHVSHHPRAAAVAHVLQLDEDAVGVREVQLRRPFLRPAAVLHAHADVMAERTHRSGLTLARLDAVTLERFQDLVEFEVFERHAEVIDARRTRCRRRAAGTRLR